MLIATNVVLVLACIGSAAALTKIRTTIADVPVVDIGSSLTPGREVTEPRNFLIIGTDSAARIDESDPITRGREGLGELADVIMILRVDPGESSARLLSIPRDSRVAVAPNWNMRRINEAIAGPQGPRNLVQTIKRNFGISIDNYVQVDFQSFRDLVEVLDGVPVYFSTPVRDRKSNLYINEPGCRMLDEQEALAYARSRHFEYQVDGKWKKDPSSDHGRIARQQDFIKRALRRASDKGLRNPTTAVGIVNAATGVVLLDDTLDVGTILTLVTEFRSFNPDTLISDQVPTRYSPRGGVDFEEIQWQEAEPLLEPFRGVDPDQPLSPANVIIDVRGGSAIEDDLQQFAAELDGAGFDAEMVQGRSVGSRTTMLYGPGGREAALLVAAHLEATPEVELDEDISGYRVVLSVGSDFEGIREQPLPLEQLPPDLLPEDTSPPFDGPGHDLSGDDLPATEPQDGDQHSDGLAPVRPVTTTTEVPGLVALDSEAAATCR